MEKCKWCLDDAHIKQGRIYLCKKHYRFLSMRVSAKRNGKPVPSYDDLQLMFDKTGLRCQNCDSELVWTRKEGNVITLQHDDSGEYKFLCTPCNTKHATSSRDLMYLIKEDESFCKRCQKILPKSLFYLDKYKNGKVKSSCKSCCNSIIKAWRANNKDKYNEYQRKFRERSKH